MYIRICTAFFCVLAIVIAAGLLPRKKPIASPDIPPLPDDAGLNRRIRRLSFDRLPQVRAIDEVRAEMHVSIAYAWEHEGSEPPDAPISLSLKDVTVGTALRLIADGSSQGTLDGQVIVTGDDELAMRTFRAYDVRDLVSPPAVPGIILPASTPPPDDRYLVAGIHGGPRLLALPPVVDEQALSEVLNSVLMPAHYGVGSEFEARKQVLPGRLLGLMTSDADTQVRDALAKLRQPIGLASARYPGTLLDRRIARLKLDVVPMDEAIDRIGDATGTSIDMCWQTALGIAVSKKAVVSADLGGVSLRTALFDLIARAYGDQGHVGVFETDGVVVAGLFDNPDDRVLRVYDVSEILRRHGASLTRMAGVPGTVPSPAQQQEQALIDLIVGGVDPATWIQAAPPEANARIVSWRGRLLILQSPQIHRDVWRYLHHVLQYGLSPAGPQSSGVGDRASTGVQ